MSSSMGKKEYMREYRIRHRETLLAKSRARYETVRKHEDRSGRRKNPQERCSFCTILLVSRFAGKGRRKYCDGCIANPDIKQMLNAMYQRRAYRKRAAGIPVMYDEADFPLKKAKEVEIKSVAVKPPKKEKKRYLSPYLNHGKPIPSRHA